MRRLKPMAGRLLCAALAASMLASAGIAIAQPAAETPAQFAKRTKWWREARFGMFIHWGIYAVPADSHNGAAEWHFSNSQMQVKDYEKYAPQFNPVRFNAAQWVRMAKSAGMKYIVITTKHHDGFAIFDAKNSDYTILRATPFKRDPISELAAECERQGVRLCFYHSIMDWHHPDYLPRRSWETTTRPADGAQYDRYVAYLKEQLRELVTTYKPGVLWFDGEWEDTWTHARGLDLYRYVRGLYPPIMVNNRVDKGRNGMAGMNASNEFVGDFGTPEQEVPPQGFADDRLWETCMTMNNTWGYSRTDHDFKSPETLIHTLCDVAHKGGNYLLNVGPTESGEFPPESIASLAAMGRWMSRNHDSIYATSKSPFRKLSFDGRCTRKGDRLYLHVFHWPEAGLEVTGLKTPVTGARILATGETLSVHRSGGAEGELQLSRPKALDPYATVVELRLSSAPVVEQTASALKAANGVFELRGLDAETHGSQVRYESGGGKDNIGYWMDASDYVTWTLDVPHEGDYTVKLRYACEDGSAGSEFTIGAEGGSPIAGTVTGTGGWAMFAESDLSGERLHLKAGKQTVAVRVTRKPGLAVMNLQSLRLAPAP